MEGMSLERFSLEVCSFTHNSGMDCNGRGGGGSLEGPKFKTLKPLVFGYNCLSVKLTQNPLK